MDVHPEDGGHGGAHGFGHVAGVEGGFEFFLRLARLNEHDAQRTHVRRRRAHLGNIVHLPEQLIVRRLVAPGTVGPGLSEYEIQAFIICLSHCMLHEWGYPEIGSHCRQTRAGIRCWRWTKLNYGGDTHSDEERQRDELSCRLG